MIINKKKKKKKITYEILKKKKKLDWAIAQSSLYTAPPLFATLGLSSMSPQENNVFSKFSFTQWIASS
jgi:hypothetical protein